MNANPFFRGMGIGIAIGSAIGISCMPKKKKHHPMKKRAEHAIQLVANCMDDLSSAMH